MTRTKDLHVKEQMGDTLRLQRGYDWLCRCGESNYEDERECAACSGPRELKEINYLTTAHINENEEQT